MQNLQTVNRSTPQLVHAPSKQSVTASDDYYSLESDASSHDESTAVLLSQFQTPPSHMQSRQASKEMLQSEATTPTIRHVIQQNSSTSPIQQPSIQQPPSVHFEDGPAVKRKPISLEGIVARRAADPEPSPSTPGVDDTPYIRFAIDQLTRDEEILEARRAETASETPYSVQRLVSHQSQEHPKDKDFESRQERQSFDTVIRHPNLPRKSSTLMHAEKGIDDLIASKNVFLPTEPLDDHRHPSLDFIPGPLHAWSLGLLLLCCLLMMTLIAFCNIWSIRYNGLLQYDGVSTSRYFLFEFFPQILASIILIWLLTVQVAIVRIYPFAALASSQTNQHSSILRTTALFSTNFLIPYLSFFKHEDPLLGSCFIIFWLVMFTVPLQSCLFQTRYYTLNAENVWRWTSVQGVGWTLFAIYVLLYAALAFVLLRFRRRRTGLKWDAASLADILTLVRRSNILADLEGSETGSKLPKSRKYRLGYWRTSNQPNENFHAIGEANEPDNRYFAEHGKTKPKADNEKDTDYTSYDIESQGPVSSRHHHLPWFLRDTFVVLWAVIALILTLAFVIVSFVNHAVANGFLPQLPASTSPDGFSPADFLYSFLPSLLGMVLYLLWQPIDLYFRALQPFAALNQSGGASAEDSLLLEYTACLPIEVTLKAALEGHWRVAYISFISILSSVPSVLAGGVFTAQYFPHEGQVRVAAAMPAYVALVVFVVIYALSFLVIWPGRKRALPHDIRTLGQIISCFNQSPLVHDAAFKDPLSKTDLVTRLLGKGKGVRYAFGVYRGVDGREHFGIESMAEIGLTRTKKR